MDRLTFLNLVRQSRLLSEEQLALVGRQLGDCDTAAAVASRLVAAELLTPFQVRRLTDGQAKGLVLGQYRLLDEIGSGGFGHVYKALHAVMGRVVAVKVLSPRLVEETRARTWFRREVQAVTQLYHPNIVMAYDANEADGFLFLVMEYIDGSNLEAVIRDGGPLPVGRACEMLRQAGRALQYAHERGMVHRDIKPANLLVPRAAEGGGPAAAVKVVDFGMARLHSTAAASMRSQTENGFLGTPAFVAPEQARAAAAADIRSDLYSLGCTFYYALTGRKPFGEGSVYETLYKHQEEEAEPVEALRPEVPAGLSAVIRRLMAKDPADRFQTPAELVAELGPLCPKGDPTPLPAARPSRPPGPAPVPENPALVATAFTPVSVVGDSSAGPPDEGSARGGAADTPLPGPDGDPSWSRIVAACFAPGSVITPDDPAAASHQPGGDADPAPADLPSWDDEHSQALWAQWTGVVAFFERGGDEHQVDEDQYRELHGQLLGACRARAASAEGELLARLGELESLVAPWLTPHALAVADRATLASLLARAREFEDDVFGPRPGGVSTWVLLGALALAAVAAAVLFLPPRVWGASARSPVASAWAVVEAYPILSIALVLPAVILVSIAAVTRRSRS